MIVLDVLFVHDIHEQGIVIGPVSGDDIAINGLTRLGGVEPPQETDMNDNSRAQLAPFQPREDRVTLATILRLIFAPKKGKHS